MLDERADGVRVLPQAAERLDTRPDLWPDEVRVRVERLNLDAASFRQLREERGTGAAVRRHLGAYGASPGPHLPWCGRLLPPLPNPPKGAAGQHRCGMARRLSAKQEAEVAGSIRTVHVRIPAGQQWVSALIRTTPR